jgi:hypothetical protein
LRLGLGCPKAGSRPFSLLISIMATHTHTHTHAHILSSSQWKTQKNLFKIRFNCAQLLRYQLHSFTAVVPGYFCSSLSPVFSHVILSWHCPTVETSSLPCCLLSQGLCVCCSTTP